jgi:hypothetical protein
MSADRPFFSMSCVQKDIFYVAILGFLFLCFGYYVRSMALIYAVVALAIAYFLGVRRYSKDTLNWLLAFFLLSLIPLPLRSVGIDIARDLTFLLLFFLSIFFGKAMALRFSADLLMKGMFFAGLFVTAGVGTTLIASGLTDYSLLAVREITAGAGDFGILMIVLAFIWRRRPLMKLIFFTGIVLALLTQSRTMLLQLLIFGFFFIQYRYGAFGKWMATAVGTVAIITLVAAGIGADDQSYTITGKLLRSIQEIIPSEDQNIHSNWRAVESAVALDAFINGGVVQQIIGQGLGYRVQLGFMMTLNDVDFESIPILHNGYFYILLKYGALGLVLWYKALSALVVKSGDRRLRYFSRACFWSILASQLVSAGVMQYSQLPFLVALAACAQLSRKNELNKITFK